MLQHLLKQREGFRIEVGRIVGERHRQHGMHPHAKIEHGLRYEQVRAIGHSDGELQL